MIQRLGSRESYRRKMTNSNQAMAQSSAASQEQVPHWIYAFTIAWMTTFRNARLLEWFQCRSAVAVVVAVGFAFQRMFARGSAYA